MMVGSFVFFILHCVISGMNILVIYLYRTKIVHIITPFDISMIHLFPLLLLLLHPPPPIYRQTGFATDFFYDATAPNSP